LFSRKRKGEREREGWNGFVGVGLFLTSSDDAYIHFVALPVYRLRIE